nr:SKP1-like protein 1A [Tanacetum cinerariifolium]
MSKSSKTIVLKSSDGQTFEIEEAAVQLMETIKPVIQQTVTKTIIIPVPNVAGNFLSKIIDYCRKHVSHKEDDKALIEFDTEFVNVDEATLISLADVARVLEIKCLSSLCTLV